MPATVQHVFTNAVADGADAGIVRPSDWNSSHLVTVNAVGSELSGAFSNSNGVSFGLEAGGALTASHNALTTAMASNRGTDFVQATAAFAGTSASGTIASGGISVSIGPYITTAALSNHSHGDPQLNLTNLSGTTASNSGGFTLSLSAAAPGGGGLAVAAGTQTATNGTVVFSNSNGVTFGMSGSTRVTASHDGLTTARASTDAIGLNTAQTNVTWTVNSSGLSLNAGGYAGTSTGFAGANISGSMTHNTLGLNLSLSVAAPGGGAAPVMSFWQNMDLGSAVGNTGATVQSSNGTLHIFPLAGAELVLPAQITCSTMMFELSVSGSTATLSSSHSSTVRIGIYTISNNGSSLALVNSCESSWSRPASSNNSTAYNGRRFLTIHSSQWSSSPVFSAGVNYYVGVWQRSSNAAPQTCGWVGQHFIATYARSGTLGVSQPAAATWQAALPFMGIYATSFTTALPAAIHNTQLNKQSANAFFARMVIMNNLASSY